MARVEAAAGLPGFGNRLHAGNDHSIDGRYYTLMNLMTDELLSALPTLNTHAYAHA
jgi:hypothetical protein